MNNNRAKSCCRILLVDDILDIGGKERQLLTALEVLKDYHIEVHLALLKGRGVLGEKAVNLADGHLICSREKPFSLSTIRELRRYIKKNDVKLVHCNGVIDAFHVALAVMGLDVKLVCTVHGFEKGIHLFVHRLILSRFDAVIAVSSSFLTGIRKLGYRSKLFRVIPNSYSTDFISQDIHPGITNSPPKSVMVSRFDWSKDQITVVQALKKLKESGFPIVLDLIGSGEKKYLEPVREQVSLLDMEDSVNFMGVVDNLSELLSSYDLMIMSSRAESFGIALVEGMAAGLPVIASDILPFREITDNGVYGILFRTGDSDDLSRKLVELVSSRKRLREMSDLAAKRASSFSPEEFGLKTIELYEELLGSDGQHMKLRSDGIKDNL